MADPRILAIRDSIRDDLSAMATDQGQFLTYAPAVVGRMANPGKGEERGRPVPYVRWIGPADGQDGAGEMTGNRFRRFELFEVSFTVREPGGDAEAKAWRIAADVHSVLIGTSTDDPRPRKRGIPCVDTFEMEGLHSWQQDTHDGTGGLLRLVYMVRYEHVSGDMTAAS